MGCRTSACLCRNLAAYSEHQGCLRARGDVPQPRLWRSGEGSHPRRGAVVVGGGGHERCTDAVCGVAPCFVPFGVAVTAAGKLLDLVVHHVPSQQGTRCPTRNSARAVFGQHAPVASVGSTGLPHARARERACHLHASANWAPRATLRTPRGRAAGTGTRSSLTHTAVTCSAPQLTRRVKLVATGASSELLVVLARKLA